MNCIKLKYKCALLGEFMIDWKSGQQAVASNLFLTIHSDDIQRSYISLTDNRYGSNQHKHKNNKHKYASQTLN